MQASEPVHVQHLKDQSMELAQLTSSMDKARKSIQYGDMDTGTVILIVVLTIVIIIVLICCCCYCCACCAWAAQENEKNKKMEKDEKEKKEKEQKDKMMMDGMMMAAE